MQRGRGLSNIQRELLKMFAHDLPESQLQEIRELLAKYFEEKVNAGMDELWEKNDWNEQQMDSWSKEHMRKK
jgi:hypothetical protein